MLHASQPPSTIWIKSLTSAAAVVHTLEKDVYFFHEVFAILETSGFPKSGTADRD
jgi:hypothetical protein